MPSAAVDAAQAAIESIAADINDSVLKAPRDGRVQYRVAQPGEVLAAGGTVLNLVDLGDVYMTFFLPTAQAGRVAIGAEVRLVLDAAPQYVIPAKVTFVADVAQFTPKTVETAEERQKLMFRVKAQIAPELLRKHIEQVKTGLPGMAYVRLDRDSAMAGQSAGSSCRNEYGSAQRIRRTRQRGASGRRRPALRQDARARCHHARSAGRPHGRPDRAGRRRQIHPAGADRRRARDPGGPQSRCSAATWPMRAIAGRACPRIAYMPQGLGKNLYPTLSVFENVDFFGRLFGHGMLPSATAASTSCCASTGLAPFADRPAGKLSGGMKQKLGLCCALIHDPDLLILDEPTTGVDPLSRRQFWELIDRIRAQPARHERASSPPPTWRRPRGSTGWWRWTPAGCSRPARRPSCCDRPAPTRSRRPSSPCCPRRSASGHHGVVIPPRTDGRRRRRHRGASI